MSTIFDMVNEVAEQAFGASAPKVVDTNSLVSLGDYVLDSNLSVEKFTNVLLLRIGKTIISFRAYRNKLNDMVLNDFEYGAIMQKIKVDMPEAIADPTYSLVEGQSVDDMKVFKEKVHQKLFYTNTPYVFPLTMMRVTLKEAFLSEAAMGAYIAAKTGELRNAIEVSFENLGRATIANFLVNAPEREIKLVSNYNSLTGSTLTATNAMQDKAFIAYAVGQIKTYSRRFTDMSKQYNDGSTTRHTPYEDQRLRMLSEFIIQSETVLQAEVFNANFVTLNGYSELNFWQNAEAGNERNIIATNSAGTETSINNIVAVLHDRDALGMYKMDEYVLTTPVNALGSYYNSYWHDKQMWFNDLSENLVFFTLN